MKELFIRHKTLVITTMAAIAVAGVVTVAASMMSEDNPCEQYSDIPDFTETFGQNESVRSEHNGEMGFMLDNWCTIQFNDDDSCQCALELKKLEFLGGGWPASGTVDVTFKIPNGQGGFDTEFVNADVNVPGGIASKNIKIYEGTKVVITGLPAGISPNDGMNLRCGGLCIVENIDGGGDDRSIKIAKP